MIAEDSKAEEILAVIQAVNAIGRAADSKDWIACGRCFTQNVSIDHDAGSGEPSSMTPDELMAAWQKALGVFTSTLHMVTNHDVEIHGDRAVCRSYVQALHVAAETTAANHYLTFGTYEHGLTRMAEGWRVNRVVYRQAYALGNPSLFPH
ncbi:MAG: nuclear transport factor 2 family protein [Pseudomonadota bacterium]